MDLNKRWIILEQLVPVILNNVKGDVVEIGVGGSTPLMSSMSEQFDRNFYSCDLVFVPDTSYNKHEHFKMNSLAFLDNFKDEKLSVVFLDGCHDYNVVKEEFNFFYTKLNEGGVIFLHDTLPPPGKHACGTVYKLREDLEQNNFNCLTWPYTAGKGKVKGTGLTMVIKKTI